MNDLDSLHSLLAARTTEFDKSRAVVDHKLALKRSHNETLKQQLSELKSTEFRAKQTVNLLQHAIKAEQGREHRLLEQYVQTSTQAAYVCAELEYTKQASKTGLDVLSCDL
jgi:uncharacterized protein (DUF3084 family)